MSLILALLFWLSASALFWTYFGYPLLMALRAKLAARPIQQDESYLPSVTLLIPAHNEADVIRDKLENALSLDYPTDQLQIIVVDDGSTDGTTEIVRAFEDRGVQLIRQPERSGKMAAVNRGFEAATGELVVLSDASPIYAPNALRLLARNFADPSVGVVVGALRLWDAQNAVAKPAGLYWQYESALRRWESLTGSTVAVHGNMFAVRRGLYRPLRRYTINDEFSIAMEVMRQGYRVVYEPHAVSYDIASATMSDEFKRRARINAGRFQALFSAGYLRAPTLDLTFRLISHKLLRPLTPIFMLVTLISAFLLMILSALNLDRAFWFWLLAFFAQDAFYMLAYAGYLAERNGRSHKLLSVPYFFVSSNLAALVGLWRWLRNRQSVTWQKRANS
ncbi:MAG: glycosyltransferase family 2 protein [Candidatus Thermofonsia Clade 1 bacterium]|jgi:cellulose synthase/poly-beta-1,6-N-acetylglucosamine synthase-like glycosyltransferase|uniref:Glycosyltransferase family 2 protein n=1 Tax=Candidatus Thermofonsia Clade 1 bacterium TaxID=2364210 RepID=A0A2M8PGR1_9CHLR|nr:MAG: glycosyltransferase family 2 protein [Candidatus Thermofonsia Clade 1 bacterium]